MVESERKTNGKMKKKQRITITLHNKYNNKQ